MSDYSEQFSELQKSWVAQQQKMLGDWLGSLKDSQDNSARASWRQVTDVMEQQVVSALDAQKTSLLSCVANMEGIEGAPEAMSSVVVQLKSGIEQWADVQQEMWRVWFDTLRNAAPAPATPADALMESWEDMVKRTMSIQAKWLAK